MSLRLSNYFSLGSELVDLIVAGIVAAFGLAGTGVVYVAVHPLSYYGGIVIGAVAGLVLHEYAHRAAGRRVGCSARFVLYPVGLLITLVFGFLRSFGFWFTLIMPGFVAVTCGYGLPGRWASYVSAWGPAVNIILAVLAYLFTLLPGSCCPGFLYGFRDMNAWLAFFNLLPFYPLDGAKVLRYSPLLWLLMILVAGVLVYVGW